MWWCLHTIRMENKTRDVLIGVYTLSDFVWRNWGFPTLGYMPLVLFWTAIVYHPS